MNYFCLYQWTFVHSKCKRSWLRLQCWMRLFLWFSNTVFSVFQYSKLVSSLPLAFCIFRHFFNSILGLESSRKLTTNTATKSLKVWNSSDEFIEDFVAQWTFPEEAAKLLTLAIFLPFISSRLLLKTNRKKHDFTWVPKRAEQKHSIFVAKNSVEIALFTTIKATFFDSIDRHSVVPPKWWYQIADS